MLTRPGRTLRKSAAFEDEDHDERLVVPPQPPPPPPPPPPQLQSQLPHQQQQPPPSLVAPAPFVAAAIARYAAAQPPPPVVSQPPPQILQQQQTETLAALLKNANAIKAEPRTDEFLNLVSQGRADMFSGCSFLNMNAALTNFALMHQQQQQGGAVNVAGDLAPQLQASQPPLSQPPPQPPPSSSSLLSQSTSHLQQAQLPPTTCIDEHTIARNVSATKKSFTRASPSPLAVAAVDRVGGEHEQFRRAVERRHRKFAAQAGRRRRRSSV